MRLGDVVLTQGSSSSSSSSTSMSGDFTGIINITAFCDMDLYYIYDVIKTSDGYFLAACAVAWSYCALIKYNENGVIWAKAFRIKHEGPDAEGGFVSEIDGYYYASFKFWTDVETYSSSMLYKIDSDGNEVWHKSSYSCWADDFPRGVIPSIDDSTSIIWFFSYYDGGGDFSGGYTPVYYKLDKETGNTIWVKGMLNDGYGVYMQTIYTQDNNYLLAHSLQPYQYRDYLYNAEVHYQPTLMKVDSSMNKIWAKHYYRKNVYIIDIITSVKLTADSGFVLLIDAVSTSLPHLWSSPYSYDTLVLKVDSSGVPQWCTKIKNTGTQGNYFDDVPCKIHVLDDGYVFNCYQANNDDYALIKLSLTGSFVWGKSILVDNLPDYLGFYDGSVEMTDTGFVLYGNSGGRYGQNSITSIHTDFDGNIPGCPYIANGIPNEIVEGYVTDIVYETLYIKMIDATYLWTFEQPTNSVNFDLQANIIYP